MNIKCMILLCVTFYIPAINAIEKPELDFLWNAIKNVKVEKDYIHLSDLVAYYDYNEITVLFTAVTTRFGVPFKNDEGDPDVKLEYDGFIKAADEGFIPRWELYLMRDKFEEIASRGPYGLQIFFDDIKKHDKYSKTKINAIMKKFGCGLKEEQPRLSFFGFIRAVNAGKYPVLDLNARLCK
ncbi:uncharacterized protein LOC126834689 [Adelges cooleyi]|uniref:uncharacterized protein LOC126834689 n=1 Tax=Adelges cooleyi TaxID=133065 RepID=UPI0021801B99|nr:uncharacterized protein LOC126834689 [Adelges cooleyi]